MFGTSVRVWPPLKSSVCSMFAVDSPEASPVGGQITPVPPAPGESTELLAGGVVRGRAVVVGGLATAGCDHGLPADDVDSQMSRRAGSSACASRRL